MKNLTIKQRLVGMILILVLLVAGLSCFFVNRFEAVGNTYREILQARIPQERVATLMTETMLGLRVNLNEAVGVERDTVRFTEMVKRVQGKLEVMDGLIEAILKGSPDLGRIIPEERGLAVPPCRQGGIIESLARKVSQECRSFKATAVKILESQGQYLALTNSVGWYDSQDSSQGVVKALVEMGRRLEGMGKDPQIRLLVMELRRQEKNILQRADQRYVDRLSQAASQLLATAQGDLKRQVQAYFDAFQGIFAKVLRQEELKEELKTLVRRDLRDQQKVMDQAVAEIAQRAHGQMMANAAEAMAMESAALVIILAVAATVAVLSLVFGWLIAMGITRVLQNTITSLDEGSDQVVAASSQVSGSSQSLAQGASEQAASLEETASSLEEIASMSQNNADHASQANQLMREAGQVVSQANDSMGELTGSMQQITQSSDEIAKIIKTIDEIAFQTNLLALNAAVEAARAGEHGAGFAVVSEEVRNLAMRAGEAARSTAVLIEGNVVKVREGSSLVDRTNQAFHQVATSAAQVADLVGEIAVASQEQAQGVGQINRAMSEMDKVIQANAANAEESASASEELSAQAEQMKDLVGELVKLVGGGRNGQAGRSFLAGHGSTKALPQPRERLLPAPAKPSLAGQRQGQKLIGLKEDDFRSF